MSIWIYTQRDGSIHTVVMLLGSLFFTSIIYFYFAFDIIYTFIKIG
jgi:hypothetical protein